jgi:2-methylcitrate dehydratase
VVDATVSLIADYSHALRYEDLPPEIVHHCKRCVVDTLGCALGGFDAEPSRIAREMAQRVSVADGARVIGTSHRTLPELATFANGVMARYLDGNDTYIGGGGHPSDSIAAILAAADIKGADGHAIITAIVLNYEVYYSLYKAADVFSKGIDDSFYVAVGSALGAAKILGLDRARTADAISLAISSNIVLDAVRYGHLSMWKGAVAGNAARNGMFAALLANAGMTSPDQPIEGDHGLQNLIRSKFELLPFARGNERPFGITQVTLKYYIAVTHALPVVTVGLPLSRKVNYQDIEKVTMYTYNFAWRVTGKEREKWRPTTREAADHSLPYILAVSLIDGDFSDQSFSEEHLRDPRIRELIDKIEVREDPELTSQFPQGMPCRVEIETKSGEHIVEKTDNGRGHYKNPMSDDEINAKFHNLAQRVLPQQRIEGALAALWQLDTAPDLDAVFDAMRIVR